jgi:hypothetical protein
MSKHKIFKTEQGATLYGVIAEFPTPADLVHGAEAVRDAGYSKWDVYSPFPVHGMDDAMGLKPTKLSLLTGLVGLTGAFLGFLLQYFVTAIAYPIVVQGKPFWGWEPWTPVTFEIGVLSTAFCAIFGMLFFNRLPMWHHPLFKNERFLRTSDDRFIICIETADPKFDPVAARAMLEKAGGAHVQFVEE